jgi:hypothetical protein
MGCYGGTAPGRQEKRSPCRTQFTFAPSSRAEHRAGKMSLRASALELFARLWEIWQGSDAVRALRGAGSPDGSAVPRSDAHRFPPGEAVHEEYVSQCMHVCMCAWKAGSWMAIRGCTRTRPTGLGATTLPRADLGTWH